MRVASRQKKTLAGQTPCHCGRHRRLRMESLEARCLLAANVVINEIHYNPANAPATGAKIPAEFVELYNAGTDAANLSGWTVNKWWFAQSPLKAATGITRSGSTATVALAGHGYSVGDSVRISGATQSQYNGVCTITAVTADTFSYTISGTPGSDAGKILAQNNVKKITGFSAVGTTATVTLPNHGYTVGETVIIRDMGAATHYEQLATVASVATNTFTCTLPDVTSPWSTSVLTAQKAQTAMPALTLGASGYLVLALDAYGFRAAYPTVTNLVDAWTGGLSNDGEKVQVNDAAEQVVDKVSYKSEYPWPVGANGDGPSMELIHPALDNDIGGSWRTDTKKPATLTSSGSVATVTLANHGYAVGDPVRISGADQLAYDGSFTVTAVTATTFTYNMSSSPGRTGTGLILAQRVGGTPGRQNSVYATSAPPQTRQVDVSPKMPSTSQPATMTIKATDPDGVASVSLQYQVVLPGQYIPAYLPVPIATLESNPALLPTANPDYANPANWTSVAMHDDGLNGDAVAGDSIYTVVLPAQAANRTLVRYRITAADTLGASVTVPYADDPSLNFAYYVYNGVPAYQAGAATYSAAVMNSLPVYSIITRQADWVQMSGWNAADQIPMGNAARQAENWLGTLVYDGVAYDNIRYRTRGATGRYYGTTKRSMVYRFNNGNYFQAYDLQGNPYPTKWHAFDTIKGFNNAMTLTYGVNEALCFYLYNSYGAPAPNTQYMQLRVVQSAQEAPDAFRGDFWGIELLAEYYDAQFLKAHDLAQGNLYKLSAGVTDPEQLERYQAPYAVTDGSDKVNTQANLTAGQSTATINAWVDMDEWMRWHTIVEAVRDYDFWPTENKNKSWYFEPDYSASYNNYGSLWTMPYDTDLSWGYGGYGQGQDTVYAAIFPAHVADFGPAYFSHVREVRDLLWQPDQINSLIDHITNLIAPLGEADYYRWINAPSDAGNYSGMNGPAMSGFANVAPDLKKFAFVGGDWPWGHSEPAGGRATSLDSILAGSAENAYIPNTPTVTYTGPAGYPNTGLTFSTTAFSDPQGNNTFRAMQWRMATYTKLGAAGYDPKAPFKLELNADWESGPLTTFNNTIAIPSGLAESGKWYRVRVRVQDTTGRWSHWSAPVEFTATSADVQGLHDLLRISEINYSPSPPTAAEIAAGLTDREAFEFIELVNTSTTQTLNLANARLTTGVVFDFSTGAITSMAPGDRVLVVKNQPAFLARYGTGPRLLGEYTGSLNNGGEQVVLADRYGASISDFTYGNSGAWPGRADGKGSTLEVINTSAAYNDPTNWRSSTEFNGSPGAAGVGPMTEVVINEVLAHTDQPLVDAIELCNTTGDAIDISGWWLSDTSDDYFKFQIPEGTVLAAQGYVVFYQGHYVGNEMQYAANEFGGGDKGFGLNSAHGDDVWLIQMDTSGNITRFADHAEFGATASGESVGRWQDDQGNWHFYPMRQGTLSQANDTGANGPRVGPLVISEVMYSPKAPLYSNETTAGFTSLDQMEYVEVYNPTGSAVDLTNWQLAGAVTYAFAAHDTLPAYAAMLVVPFDATNAAMLSAFRASTRYRFSASVKVVGPYSGHMSDTGEKVSLLRPDVPPPEEPTFCPALLEDEVSYASSWGGSGDGKSLTRRSADAWGMNQGSWTAAATSAGAMRGVAGRYVFYNDSSFDKTSGAGTSDDAAIATDKTPLLPGGQASFVNYTSYSRGINGIMVDLLSPPGTVAADDFTFRVGNDNHPALWTAAPAPTSISQRTVSGATRVTMIWADGAIRNQWLQVTVLAYATTTGLPVADVFYFGNAIGETGNRATAPGADAVVDASDETDVRANETGATPAPVTSSYDLNRDRRINATDELLVRANYRQGATALELIHPAATASAAQAAAGQMLAAAAAPSGSDTAAAKVSSAVQGPSPVKIAFVSAVVRKAPSAPHSIGPALPKPPSAQTAARDTVLAAAQPAASTFVVEAAQWKWLRFALPNGFGQPATKQRNASSAALIDRLLAALHSERV